MIRRFVKDDIGTPGVEESHAEFDARVNAAIDEYRDANLVVNYTPIPGGEPTIYAQIGAQEPIVQQGQMVGMRFNDLSTADVQKRLDQRKSSLARGPSGVLRPGPRD